jgi:ribosomal protein S18 acetylase RimI-like enzyme
MLPAVIPGFRPSKSLATPSSQNFQKRKPVLEAVPFRQPLQSDIFVRTPRPLFSAAPPQVIPLGLIDVGSDKVLLRQGRISDFPAIAAVLKQVLPAFNGEEGEGSSDAGSSILSYCLEQPLEGEGNHNFENDPNKVVGCVCLVPQTDERVETKQAAELTKFYLLPAYRGGTGETVGNYVLNRAAGEMNYRFVYLTTHRRFTAARALYRKLGFENLPKSLDDPPYDAETVSMVKKL